MSAELTKAQQAEAMARRLLWLAFCWNDHNFAPAHEEARKEAEKHGIRSFDDANTWLTSDGVMGNGDHSSCSETPPKDGKC